MSQKPKPAEVVKLRPGLDASKVSTPFDDDEDGKIYKWSAIGRALKIPSNVHNRKWWPDKVMPLLLEAGVPISDLLTDQGSPKKLSAQWVGRYKVFCGDRELSYEDFKLSITVSVSKKYEKSDDMELVVPEMIEDDEDDDISGLSSNFSVAALEKGGAIEVRQTAALDAASDLQGQLAVLRAKAQQSEELQAALDGAQEKEWKNEIFREELQKASREIDLKNAKAAYRLEVQQAIQSELERQ